MGDNARLLVLFIIAAIVIIPIIPSLLGISGWAVVGVYLSLVIFIQLGIYLRTRAPFLHVMLLNYCVQLLLASLVLYYFPPFYIFDIGRERYAQYLAFAVPACLGLFAGVTIATIRLPDRPFSLESAWLYRPNWANYSWGLLGVGTVFFLLERFISPTSPIFFAIDLIAAARWVGVFALVLSGIPRAPMLLAGVLTLELLSALSNGMFHDLVLWTASSFLILAYRYGWRFRAIAILLLSLLFLVLFQGIKLQFRGKAASASFVDKIAVMFSLLTGQVSSSSTLIDPQALSFTMVRFNEGWIVDRVMRVVPDQQRYAGGSTIVDGIINSFVPRLLVPDKPEAGGKYLFNKYTGRTLAKWTWMSVSVTGEMYINFGPYGVFGMLAFGLFLGLLYRQLANRAYWNPVWWAWAPYVGLWAMKAEEDLMTIENEIVKGLLMMALIIWVTNRLSARTGNRHHQSDLPTGGMPDGTEAPTESLNGGPATRQAV